MVSAVTRAGNMQIARREVERVPPGDGVRDRLVDHGAEHADLRIRCGRGCYVRSIAHELGERLGVPAHLETLRRTALGAIQVESAIRLDELLEAVASGQPIPRGVRPLASALDFLPALFVRDGFEAALRHGTQPGPQHLRDGAQKPRLHRVFDAGGRMLLALRRWRARAWPVRLECVFARSIVPPAVRRELCRNFRTSV
jgi:tRNA pseudouridine55 synthase